jgi:predicted RND superfamily exporter protein
MNRFIAKFVLGYPKTTILISFLITFLLASGIRNVSIEEDLKEMLPDNLPSRQALNKIDDIFGGSDVMLITIANEQETIFNKGTLAKILALTDSMDVIPGVNKVTSLATVKHIEGEEWGLEVTPFLEEVPETEDKIDNLKNIFYEDSLYVGTLVSANGKYATVLAVLSDDAETNQINRKANKLKAQFEGPEKIYLSGMPVVMTHSTKNIRGDIQKLIPLVLLVVIIILYLSLGTIPGVVLPLLTTVMAVLGMVGTMGHIREPFMMVSNIMPVVLVAVGVAYGIHVISGYYEELQYTSEKKTALTKTIEHIGIPVLMAGVTTMVGFLSLMTSPLPVFLVFGSLLALGVFLAMFFSLTMIPAILLLLPVPKKKVDKKNQSFFDPILSYIANYILRFRKTVIVLGIALAIIFAFGIPRINIEMNPLTFFPEKSDLIQANKTVDKQLAGSLNMNLLFKGDIQSTEMLQTMDSVQQFLERYPETGTTMSLATIVKRINRSLHADDPQFEKIPEDNSAVAQAILLYNMSGSPEDYEQFVDTGFENAQVTALMKAVGTNRIAQIAKETEQFYKDNFKDAGAVEITGLTVFIKDLAQIVISSQARSLIFALFAVAFLAWLTYRSWKIGILAIIPLAITIIFNFGLMGYAGIDLSIPTAMISSIIIGIGVDFSFHLLSRYKLELQKENNTTSPVVRTIRTVGKPILFNAITTGFGFSVLMVSGFVPLRFMGLLIFLTMLACAFGALTILAASLTFLNQSKGV